MSRIAVLTLLALAACAGGDTSAPRMVSMNGWRADSGMPLTRVEFNAVVASCQDRARIGSPGFAACLNDLGLKRAE